MPAVVEARSMLCAVPLDLSRGESKGVWLNRAARLLGLAPAKAKRIYYGELKRIDADTFAAMRKRSLEVDQLNKRIDALKAAEAQHREQSDEIRRDLALGRKRGVVAGGETQPSRDPLAEGGGVVPRQAD